MNLMTAEHAEEHGDIKPLATASQTLYIIISQRRSIVWIQDLVTKQKSLYNLVNIRETSVSVAL